MLTMTLLGGCQGRGESQGSAAIELRGESPAKLLTEHYQPVEVKIEAQVPQYALPLRKAAICNPQDVSLDEAAWARLLQSGFVVVPYGRTEEIGAIYEHRREDDKPIFVTTDTLLHLYHIQFGETLKSIEERDFHPRIVRFSEAMLKASQADMERMSGELKEAARRNVAYFTVGLNLLTGKTRAADAVRKEVAAELQLIEAHGGFDESPLFVYQEDYSQYVPRGHYTRSELLKRYFKGLMWYGRISMLLKGKTDQTRGLIEERDARVQTLQAALIATHLYAPDSKLVEDWNRIYGVTAFYVGTADDLTPFEYAKAIKKVCGASFEWTTVAADETLHALRSELATYRAPEIYGGTGNLAVLPPFTPEQLDEALEDTKGMRLMGQRYIPDSCMFQQLCNPAAGGFVGIGEPFTMSMSPGGPVRGFVRGLDVMAVLGSDRALAILQDEGDTAYEKYDPQLRRLREQFAGFTREEWNRNLYWSWLYSLQALIEPCGQGYPTFMQGEAWQDRSLWAALASWSELRHDTILYAKQSYGMTGAAAPGEPPPPPPPSYVEPAPEFYARLLALAKMTRTGLTAMDVLDEQATQRLTELEQTIQKLLDISVQELRNEKLSEEDYDYIDGIGYRLEAAVMGVEELGLKTTIVADVHTDGNTQQCLEEGVGYVHLLVACYPVPDGRIAVAGGPVLSQYELKQPMANRLTDEAWRELLEAQPPPRAAWTESFVVDG
ncbi:MAG: DUF3160 domain-containing protein [Armatimonadetes bacterium]|nr:DUF3160 domain-containing protein [Armatimonadota bacterium]